MALILGIDRFMSEAPALVNMIGNGVATVVMARWEGELDQARLDAALSGNALPIADADFAAADHNPPVVAIGDEALGSASG